MPQSHGCRGALSWEDTRPGICLSPSSPLLGPLCRPVTPPGSSHWIPLTHFTAGHGRQSRSCVHVTRPQQVATGDVSASVSSTRPPQQIPQTAWQQLLVEAGSPKPRCREGAGDRGPAGPCCPSGACPSAGAPESRIQPRFLPCRGSLAHSTSGCLPFWAVTGDRSPTDLPPRHRLHWENISGGLPTHACHLADICQPPGPLAPPCSPLCSPCGAGRI